jgi:toxin YoeB
VTDIHFQERAWQDCLWWQTEDRKTLRRINALLKAIMRDPTHGEGKPEPLVGDLAGSWSRRIDQQNRLVYDIQADRIIVIACRGHYSDR